MNSSISNPFKTQSLIARIAMTLTASVMIASFFSFHENASMKNIDKQQS